MRPLYLFRCRCGNWNTAGWCGCLLPRMVRIRVKQHEMALYRIGGGAALEAIPRAELAGQDRPRRSRRTKPKRWWD